MSETFALPDVGEGLTEAEIVNWLVKPGDSVVVNQAVVEIETAKSVVELPVPFAGTIEQLHADVGDIVEVGEPLVTVGVTAAAAPSASAPQPSEPQPAEPVPATADTSSSPRAEQRSAAATAAAVAPKAGRSADADEGGANLVGYGASKRPKSRRTRRLAAHSTSQHTQTDAHTGGSPNNGAAASRASTAGVHTQHPRTGSPSLPAIARPPIRKLAKDLGVTLSEVTGTGHGGEVTRQDVVANAKQMSVFRNIETPEWPAGREQVVPTSGRDEVVKVHGVRRSIAKAMVSSAFTAPHVTVFVDVDATRTMEYVRRLKNSSAFAGVKVSPLLIMAKAVIWAAQRNPEVNSSFDDERITIHHYVNLGIAAATPRGLLVPNIKEAQSLSLRELAQALGDLTATARAGRTPPEAMQHGTITITNIGVFGVDAGTPILNPGEVAITAMGAIRQKPWVVDGEVRPRFVTTVSASFDHRCVDGDVASRFTADVASVLEEPALLLDV
ncbi:dihydrolipoamide acetyltransferase family protein [Pseudoclavibacter sp. CFCC 13611]|uniref:dihydrolipoamide acetyltransferase family protein n=1 Tax=Pseudoclavibacter sp. CFCC 13611 TaxID=2615178 RepID=UPI001300D64A|nr:dihydrolipoamide acetyltransferase family protein [Pseudoclavibacter sp. CFCC 13611]KAB1663941.1 2-oxo acid dehydrogenase subunit E2 [Pseudoclavibacter sp. CFCC 13611]